MPNLSPLAEMARRENEAMRRRCGITAPMTCSMFNPNAQAQAAPSQKADWPRLKKAVLQHLSQRCRRTTSEIAEAIDYPLHGTPSLLRSMVSEGTIQKAGTMRLPKRRPVTVWECAQ
nr:hypothetical protein [uncultured Celeribacter sp.]